MARAMARLFIGAPGFAGQDVLDLAGDAVRQRRTVPADRVPAVQRHVPVDDGGVRVVLAGVDPGQPGLQHGQCRVGQREPGEFDGGDGVPLGLRGGGVAQPAHGLALADQVVAGVVSGVDGRARAAPPGRPGRGSPAAATPSARTAAAGRCPCSARPAAPRRSCGPGGPSSRRRGVPSTSTPARCARRRRPSPPARSGHQQRPWSPPRDGVQAESAVVVGIRARSSALPSCSGRGSMTHRPDGSTQRHRSVTVVCRDGAMHPDRAGRSATVAGCLPPSSPVRRPESGTPSPVICARAATGW